MLVNADGALVSGRSHPKCVLITAEVSQDGLLSLSAPDMPPLKVVFPSSRKDKAAEWKETRCT